MVKHILVTLFAWSCGVATLHAADSISVSSAEGAVGDNVEISVDLTTQRPEAVGAEIHIPLPEGVTPVEGSCVKSDIRLPDHSISADMKGNEYVVVIFNTSLKPIPVEEGTAFRFKLNLGDNPGVFDLTPTVRISDETGKPLSVSTTGGKLKVVGARLALSATDIDFGRVPIRGTYTRNITATNTGTATLNIEEITTDIPGLTVTAASQSIEPNRSTPLTLEYKPVTRAKSISGRFTVISNSVGRAPFTRVTSVPYSINELHIGNAEGISDSEVTVSVNLKNMEPIAGAEFSIRLPDALEYVEESVSTSDRASDLSALASLGSDRMLRVVLFSTGNTTINEGEGELVTFRLKLKGSSGTYTLAPQKVILSSRESENIVSSTSNGHVTISSPRIQASSQLNVGNVPLSGTNTFSYEVSNPSNVPLTIEKVVFLDDVAVCNATFPMVIESGKSGIIPITISNPSFGDFSSTMNVYSNDPNNRMKAVTIKGHFYSPNEIYIEKAIEDDQCVITGGLINEGEIVGLQLDVVMPEGFKLTESDLKLLDRAVNHSGTLAQVGSNRYRVIIFSLNNSAFKGNNGGVFSLHCDANGVEGIKFRFENIKLSNNGGNNYISPNKDVLAETLPVMLPKISMSTETMTLKAGETTELKANVLPKNIPAQEITWTSSNEAVATVSDNGIVKGISVGNVDITATSGNLEAICKVTIIPTPVESIKLNIESTQVKLGEDLILIATVSPENATDKTIKWESSDNSIALVDTEGKVSTIALGKAIITASCGEFKASCVLNVVTTPVELLTFKQELVQLKVGETKTLNASVYPEDATDKSLTWHSSDDSVVSVSVDGVVTGLTIGTAEIIASCGNISTACKVEVIPTPATSITLSQTTASLKVGEMETLTATVAPADATDKTVTWSSSNPAVATVDANGKVTAMALGCATITAKCGEVTTTCTVTVVATPATSITLDKATASLKVGETVTLTATVLPENATDKTVTWTSSNPAVATVDAYGKVTAMALGNAMITAKCGDVTATCAVTVVATPATSITLDKTTTSLKVGESVTLTATVLPSDATDKTVTWSSSNPAVATVDANGKVTAVALGNATITAKCGDVTASCAVTVVATPATSITLNQTSASLKVGESVTLTATVLPADATDKTVTWTSSNTGVAKVDSNGKVTAVALGNATITAKCGDVSTTCAVTVVATPATSITLSQTTASLKVGESVTLTATVAPSDATDKTVTWTSSNPAIATVDANGKVTAMALGSATITAKCGEVTAPCAVTVVATPATSVTLSQTSASLKVGETVALTATVAPADATDKTVTWSSSNTAVATVDANGKVTAKALGSATITAKCGNLSAICEVTVLPILVETIMLSPESWSGLKDDSMQLVATVLPANATDATLIWASSNEMVATVDGAGLVRIVAEGSCIITAKAADGSGVEAQCIITGLSGIEQIFADSDETVDVYTISGLMLKKGCDKAELQQLATGAYIVRQGQKVVKLIVK